MKKTIRLLVITLLVMFTIPALASNMVLVKGGSFIMGDVLSINKHKDEKPVHKVTLSSFYMAKYEVTQAEYQSVMGNNPSKFQGDNRPVEKVSWLDAINYCNKRSVKEGLTPAYGRNAKGFTCNFKANGYRLPTEAEWEYAARGGVSGAGDLVPNKYAGSNDADSVAWYDDNSGKTTHPVGQKSANQLGLYDMSGNVWEWCWDWDGPYSSGSATNPRGASSGTSRVLRGGGWGYDASRYRPILCVCW